jgi:hypothetical protein
MCQAAKRPTKVEFDSALDSLRKEERFAEYWSSLSWWKRLLIKGVVLSRKQTGSLESTILKCMSSMGL